MTRTVLPPILAAGVILAAAPVAPAAATIPAFARRYHTSCSTCHTAAPKLNVLGEAFRLNGYRFPENDLLLRKEESVPLGEDPWKELWPRAIWPGEIPGTVPLAIRLQNDVGLTRLSTGGSQFAFNFPHEVYLLAGASLGDQIAAFLESEWTKEDGLEVVQAKVEFQDPVSGLPERLLNVWVGMQNLYLTTFADRQIDRAGRQSFHWQEFAVSDLPVRGPGGVLLDPSENEFRLEGTQPAMELNGLAVSRFAWAVGVGQGTSEGAEDNNDRKDLYYRVRYKLGGLGLDGSYRASEGPPQGGGGQLRDRSVTLEHFGYLGGEPAAAGITDDHSAFGVVARVLFGPLDVGGGYVWGRNSDPWGFGTGALHWGSVHAKAEYLVYPWLITSLKAEHFTLDRPPASPAGSPLPGDQDRIIPGVIALIRQNVRAVVEADLYLHDERSSALGEPTPAALWVRLDVAF
jgi:hypothetical protein